MSPQDASFIPPNVTPPDPPEAKAVSLIVSVFMSILLIAFIGFISIEFLADMAGVPFHFGVQPPPLADLPSAEPDSREELKSPYELMTPKHQTQRMGPEIVVIYTRRTPVPAAIPPELMIDDTQRPWEEQYGDNTWFTRCQLQAGLHRVQVEDAEAELFVETLDSPMRSLEQWPWHMPHPDTDKTDRCHDCHERIDPSATGINKANHAIGAWKGIASCFGCHEVERHNILHAVIFPTPTDKCLRCHAMH